MKVGDKVKKGDPLSDGVIKPQELLKLKGMQAVREYMTNELSETYKGAVHHNILETVVQKVTNLTKVEDPGNSDEVLPGEFVPLSVVENLNRKGANIKHEPQLKSIKQLPRYRLDDWMAKMNLSHLSQAVLEGAQFGQSVQIQELNTPHTAICVRETLRRNKGTILKAKKEAGQRVSFFYTFFLQAKRVWGGGEGAPCGMAVPSGQLPHQLVSLYALVSFTYRPTLLHSLYP